MVARKKAVQETKNIHHLSEGPFRISRSENICASSHAHNEVRSAGTAERAKTAKVADDIETTM
jgi:hypothetical protein